MPYRSTSLARPSRKAAPQLTGPAHRPEPPVHPAAAAVRLAPADVLALQRTIGNRAVQRLIEARRAQVAAPGGIQRKVLNWMPSKHRPPILEKYEKEDDKKGKEQLTQWINKAHYVAQQLDEATMDAHEHVQGVTKKVIEGDVKLNEVVAKLDRMPHAQDFANKLADLLSGDGQMHPSAAGGYVIEDYVTDRHREDASFQVTPPELAGSRPDVVFTLDPYDEDGLSALYDITSEASAGHVLDKGGGSWVRHQKYPYVSELLYPPLKFDGTESRSLSEEELELVKQRALTKQKAVEESAAKFKMQFAQLYDVATAEAAKRLAKKDRSWVKLGGRRGTAVLHEAGLLDAGGGWAAVAFESWWKGAENDVNARNALFMLKAWLGL